MNELTHCVGRVYNNRIVGTFELLPLVTLDAYVILRLRAIQQGPVDGQVGGLRKEKM